MELSFKKGKFYSQTPFLRESNKQNDWGGGTWQQNNKKSYCLQNLEKKYFLNKLYLLSTDNFIKIC